MESENSHETPPVGHDSIEHQSGGRRRILLEDVQNPILRKGIEVWTRAKDSRRMPSRAQMTPRILAGVLRNTALVRVIGEAEEFQFRIVGDAIVQAKGMSYKNMTTADLERLVPGYGRGLHYAYSLVCTSRAPAAWRGWFERTDDARAYFQESVTLPLSDDDDIVDHLLVMGVYAQKYDRG